MVKIYLQPDNPLEDISALKGNTKLVDRILDMTRNGSASTPLLISGDWGSGKTSILKILRREIEGIVKPKDEIVPKKTVWFEAWHYEGNGNLLPILLGKIWNSAKNHKNSVAKKEKVKDLLFKSMACAAMVGTTALAPAATVFGIQFLKLLKGFDLSKIRGFLRSIERGKRLTPPDDPIEQLRVNFRDFVEQVWGRDNLTVFIDDLDRCNPDSAVGLLDAIRMLVADEKLGCQFIVAIDRGIIAKAISKKFEGIEGYDGNRYLEKLFPFSFHIPTLLVNDRADMLKNFLEADFEKSWDQDQEVRVLGDNCNDALASVLTHAIFANPRLMIRTINRFKLVTYWEAEENATLGHPELPGKGREKDYILASWIAATERWPAFRQIMQQHDDRYWGAMGDAINAHDLNQMPGPKAKRIYEEPGALTWLRKEQILDSKERLREFRKTDERLIMFGL